MERVTGKWGSEHNHEDPRKTETEDDLPTDGGRVTGKQREADSQRRCYCSGFKEGSGMGRLLLLLFFFLERLLLNGKSLWSVYPGSSILPRTTKMIDICWVHESLALSSGQAQTVFLNDGWMN